MNGDKKNKNINLSFNNYGCKFPAFLQGNSKKRRCSEVEELRNYSGRQDSSDKWFGYYLL